MSTHQRRTIVILGAGFAGVQCARELARLLPPSEDSQIVLIDQHNFFLFTPMLTEVVGAQVEPYHIVNATRRLSPCVTFMQGRIDSVDLQNRCVTVTLGQAEENIPEEQRTINADHLVIALGSVTNFHGIAGLQEHALTLKSLSDAAAIRNRALALLERADAESDHNERAALLTVVVGGGGFSGVETMAALNALLRESIRFYHNLQPDDVHTILVHAGDRLLPELSASLAAYTQRKLVQRGVEVVLNTKITGAANNAVELGNGRQIATHLLIWTGGVKPNPVIETLPSKRGEHGGIVVDRCCAVPDYPGVWAVGDCAEIPLPGGKGTYAPIAQNASREGRHLARNIVAVMHGGKPQPFVYHPIGELALVGRRSGVARVFGVNFSGPLAWAMWRAVYLAKLPRWSKQLRVLTDWLLDFAIKREIAELPLVRPVAAHEQERHVESQR
jgi:NADH dehydrogenase